MPTNVPNFNFLALFVSEIKGCPVPKFNVEATGSLPNPVRWKFHVCSKYLARANSLQPAKFQHHAVMRICISHRLSIIYAQKWGFGWFWGWRCVLTPKRHYPAWCIACQNRFNGLSSRSVEKFCVQRKKEINKFSCNFGYMGSSNPWNDLDQMWRVGRYGGRNHVCNIWWLSVKGCGCGERGKFAFSHWLEVSPLQHWTVW